ncbi:MAG: histidinol dehydrogenase [Elusimicrobia bacterium]|nr:histidinol dehydrogenase [Elusimicrobiota bacterium]
MIPRVDKIVGPGNVFVTLAKRQVFGDVGIDMLAGPSEILIIADDTANPDFIISDLTAQCEHDKSARATLVSVSGKVSEFVKNKTSKYKTQIKINRVQNMEQAVKIANEVAPEHIEIMTKNANKVSQKIRNAGAMFLGNYSPVAVGDYFAGPSHVLPTSGTSRFSSGLSVYDFLKSSSVIQYEKSALKKSAKEIMKLAQMEGLFEHAKSIEIRK